MKEIDQYEKGQIDLINHIKDQVLDIDKDAPTGFDLALDVISLLRKLKPLKQ